VETDIPVQCNRETEWKVIHPCLFAGLPPEGCSDAQIGQSWSHSSTTAVGQFRSALSDYGRTPFIFSSDINVEDG